MAPRNTRVNPETNARSPARSFTQSLDNYYAPSRDRRSEQATQEALSGFAGVFQEQAGRLKEKQRKGEKAQGVADAMREQAGQEMKGVKTGSMFRQNSSFYMAGLNETRGRSAGTEFLNNLDREYQQWEGRHGDDTGEASRAWINQRVGEFMEGLGEDPHKITGALPLVNQAVHNIASKHTAYTNERLQTENLNAFGNSVSNLFDLHMKGEMDMEDLVSSLQSEADSMYNMEGGAANDAMVEAAIMWADSRNSINSLEALVKGAEAGKLKLNLHHEQMIGDAVDMVERQIIQEENRLEADEEAHREAVTKDLKNNLWDALWEDPNLDLRKWMRGQDLPQEYREGIYRQLVTTQRTVQQARPDNSPSEGEVLISYFSEMRSAKTPEEKGEVLSKYASALSRTEIKDAFKMIEEQDDGSAVLNDKVLQNKRANWLDLVQVIDEGTVDVGQTREARVVAEGLYDMRMHELARGADPSQYGELHEQVVEEVQGRLVRFFPNYRENLGEMPAAAALGGGLQARDDQRKEQIERMEQLRNAQDGAMVLDTPGAEEYAAVPFDGFGSGSEFALDARPSGEADGEGAPIPSDLLGGDGGGQEDSTGAGEEYGSIEAQLEDAKKKGDEESFHSALLRRFTDGEDTTSTATLEKATSVLYDDPEFETGVKALGEKYGVDHMALMAIMDFETGGTFDPSEPNKAGSGATGLIQFMPKTARGLGTTTETLAQMTRAEQLKYVEKYFDQFSGKIRNGNIDDLYMAVLWPAAIGKPDGYVLFRRGSVRYEQNAGLDHNNDGTIDKYEAATKVRRTFYGY